MATKPSVIVREATAADRDFLYEMLYQSIYVTPGVEPPGREVLSFPRISRYVENWGRVGDYALIAVEADGSAESRSVGAVWLRFFPADYPGYGFIDESVPEIGIAVVPGKRGRGIGNTLLKGLLKRPAPPYTGISLSVDPENPAVKLYRRFGFVDRGRSGTSIVMLYELPVIREYRPEHARRLAHIYLESRIHAFDWLDPTRFSYSDFEHDTEGEALLVAESGNRVIGFSSSWVAENFIHHLYLDPVSLGHGVGGLLLDATVKMLGRPVRLKAQVKNPNAIWFYRKRGWTEYDRGVTDWGEYIELILR
jgi:ribosomal-protein-alanine N-acetyltransferase